MKVIISVPTRGSVYYRVASRLGQLESKGHKVVYSQSSYSVEAARRKLCKYFLDSDATHMLFVDDDVIVPSNIIDLLMLHDKDIVSASYNIQKDGDIEDSSGEFGVGLTAVERCGLGACLIKRSVISSCINLDCFAMKFDTDGDCVEGEDTKFCEIAKHAGFEVYVDFDVVCDHMKVIPLKS